jgi:hypothetical protein
VIGALIGFFFGLLWLLVGANAVGNSAGEVIAGVGILLFALAAVRVIRRPGEVHDRRFRTRYYIAAVVAEVAAIAIAQSWLASHGQSELLMPAVGIIVGLHFIGLWLASGHRLFVWLTGAMVAVNLAALLLPLSPRGRKMMSGFGSSAALLVAASL